MHRSNPPVSENQTGSSAGDERVDRRLAIAREAQAQILELYAGGMETRSLAERFGVQENYIRKLASRHGVRKGRSSFTTPQPIKPKAPPVRNGHIAAYKRARRGFAVPSRLEPEYTRLLIKGLSLREAAAELGLLSSVGDRSVLVDLRSRAQS
ncbi:MAG: hypothetical protein NXI27_25595 [Alphaproteobacteria bacterium]|nr:hypothetical protein [Alphaproteobacteria bacterium]